MSNNQPQQPPLQQQSQIYTGQQLTPEQIQQFHEFQKLQQQQGNHDEGAMLKSLYQGGGAPIDKFDLNQSNHPTACIVHFVFKALALFIYLFLSIIISSLTADEIIIIVSAVDFWIVKNITGRLLVGLRWWSEPRLDGNDDWVFECKVNENLNNPFNEKVFWGLQGIFTAIWVVLGVLNCLSLSFTSIFICGFVSITLGLNLWAYYKCSKLQKERVKEFAANIGTDIAKQMLQTSVKMPLGAFGAFF